MDPKNRTTVVRALAETVAGPTASDRGFDGAERAHDSSDRGERLAPPPPASWAALPEAGQVVGGLYRLVRPLGEGTFGRVWLAQRIDVPEHQVALKVMRKSAFAGRNPERELVMLATVGHPNVVQLKDHGAEAAFVWLTMPVYEGETLAARLARGTLSLREAHGIFVPIAQGLDALHRAGLRHQDVKPENLFLARFGATVHPVLLDLGVATERDGSFVAGTALFAAPEQLEALSAPAAGLTAKLDEKIDVYGLATTLLDALVGDALFPGDEAKTRSELQEAQALRAREPLVPDALPELRGEARDEVTTALRRWLALAPSDRPSMAELAVELDVLLAQERADERLEAARRVRQRISVLRARAAALVLFCLAAAAGLYLFSKREKLRLAGELERARAEGARHFDKLDTCVDAHSLALHDLSRCKTARLDDQHTCELAIAAAAKKPGEPGAGEGTGVGDPVGLHKVYQGRLKACEEASASTASDVATDAEDDKRTLEVEFDRERKALQKARDDALARADAAERDLATARVALDACLARPAGLGTPSASGAPSVGAPPSTPSTPSTPSMSATVSGPATPSTPPAPPSTPPPPSAPSAPPAPPPPPPAAPAPAPQAPAAP